MVRRPSGFSPTPSPREHVRVLPYGRQGHVFHICARPALRRDWRGAQPEPSSRGVGGGSAQAHDRGLRPGPPDGSILGDGDGQDRVVARTRHSDGCVAGTTLPAQAKRRRTDDTLLRRQDAVVPDRGRPAESGLRTSMPSARSVASRRSCRQYRALLSSVSSGVTYVAPTAWRGAIDAVFTRALALAGARAVNLTTVRDYFTLHRLVDEKRFASLSVAQMRSLPRVPDSPRHPIP